MTSVYILTLKKSGEVFYFTSVIAITEKFDYDILKIKYRTFNSHNFGKGCFENDHLKVERVTAYSKQDIIKEKQKENGTK